MHDAPCFENAIIEKLIDRIVTDWAHDSVTFNQVCFWGNGSTAATDMLEQKIRTLSPLSKVLRISLHDFTKGILSRIVRETTDRFLDDYVDAEILFLDDFEACSNMYATQENLYELLDLRMNIGLAHHDQLTIISSGLAPNQINGIEDRVTAVLQGGLVFDARRK